MPVGSFQRFVEQVRNGDVAAQETLVRRFEPLLRRVVHLKLTDERLRRIWDSEDIAQSVFAEFLKRITRGEFELSSAEQLRGLLVTMALNKLRTKARKKGPLGGSAADEVNLLAEDTSPSEGAAKRELLDRIRARLNPEELRLVEMRTNGLSWGEIGAREGKRPEAVRMYVTRAIARVRRTFSDQGGSS